MKRFWSSVRVTPALVLLLITLFFSCVAITWVFAENGNAPVITPLSPRPGDVVRPDSREMVLFWVRGQTHTDTTLRRLQIWLPNESTFFVQPLKGTTRSVVLRFGWDTRGAVSGAYQARTEAIDWKERKSTFLLPFYLEK